MKHVEVVCALIEREDGKFFCCQRGPGRPLEGYWEFPGGKVEANETHKQTIVREIREELNSDVLPLEYIGVSDYIYPDMGLYKGFSITLYAYRCKLLDGNLELTEHINSAWKTKDEMQQMKFAKADMPIIDAL